MKNLVLSLGLIGSTLGGINCEAMAMAERNEHILSAENGVIIFDQNAGEGQNFEVLFSNDALIQAVNNGDFYGAKHLLANKALFWAIEDGDLTKVEKLVFHEGADMNVRMHMHEMNAETFTPLSIAARYGHTDIVNFIIGHGRASGIDLDLDEALIAALGGLHDAGDITIPNGTDTTGAIDSLLDNGANIDGRTINNDTMLMLAVLNGRSRAVECLLGRNADMEVRDELGRTALMLAVHLGHTAANIASDVSMLTSDRLRARVSESIYERISKTLIGAGADVNVTSNANSGEENSVVTEAAKWGNLNVIDALIRHGANMNIL